MASKHDILVNQILNYANAQPYSTAINTSQKKEKRKLGWYDKGRADVHMGLLGCFIAVEVKIPPDDMSDDQKTYAVRVKIARAEHWKVETFEEFEQLYKAKQNELLNKTCTWKVHDFDSQIYETECGDMFFFTEEGPSENRFEYCQYCGKTLIEGKHEN